MGVKVILLFLLVFVVSGCARRSASHRARTISGTPVAVNVTVETNAEQEKELD